MDSLYKTDIEDFIAALLELHGVISPLGVERLTGGQINRKNAKAAMVEGVKSGRFQRMESAPSCIALAGSPKVRLKLTQSAVLVKQRPPAPPPSSPANWAVANKSQDQLMEWTREKTRSWNV